MTAARLHYDAALDTLRDERDDLVARLRTMQAERDALAAQLDALARDPACRQGALTELRCIIRLARVTGPGDLLDALLRRLESYGAAE